MASKTASIRLSERMFENVDKKCSEIGCCRNDFIKSAIESALENNQGKSIAEVRNAKIVESADDEQFKPHYDSHGNYWYYNHQRRIWTCRIDQKNMRFA